MSNSALSCMRVISPNRNSPRNHKIDTITIHCVVGQMGVEALCSEFSRTAKGARQLWHRSRWPCTIGSEQGGTRPVLIISNDVGNRFSPTVIIAPITSRVHGKSKLPTHTIIRDFEGLEKVSIILSEQIRTIDKQRLGEYLGPGAFFLRWTQYWHPQNGLAPL